MRPLALLLLAWVAVPAAAQDGSALAREAATLAGAAPEQEGREEALRSVASALRSTHPAIALEAAARMAHPLDLQALASAPEILAARSAAGAAERERCSKLLEAGHHGAALEARIVACGIVERHPQMLPPLQTLLRYADALPPGAVRLQVLMHAFVLSSDGLSPHAPSVTGRVRALQPHLDGRWRQEADAFLEQPEVHIAEGRPDQALLVARRSGNAPLLQVVTAWLVRNGDTDLALQAAAAWPRGRGCPFEGAPYLTTGTWTDQQRRNLAFFVDRLFSEAFYREACPGGISSATLAELQLAADRLGPAVAALNEADSRSAVFVGLMIAERYRALGQDQQARALLLALAPRIPGFVPPPGRAPIAPFNLRFRLITALAQLGESAQAERLARGYTHPSWRSAALAVVASGGRFVSLPTIEPLH